MLCDCCTRLSYNVNEPAKITYYRHLPSIGSLKSSAATCTLCSYILGCITQGDTVKPEGKRSTQIWIKICPRPTAEETWRYGLLGENLQVFCGQDSLAWQDADAEADCYFDLATTESNEAAIYISGRLLDVDPVSNSTIKKIQTWLEDCDSHHSPCHTVRLPDSRVLPSRFIDVGTIENPQTRLCETTATDSQSYMALSYCWGTGQTLVTTLENSASHMIEIPFQRLPQTIQDAIKITRNLGIRYLWVDALCIIQDSVDGKDFQQESSKMGSIYGNAYLTIAVESSESCADGFLHSRDYGRAAPLQEIPVRIPNGEVTGSAFICAPVLDEKRFLMRRAWAYQEQRLSRRVLHYRSRGLDMCCRAGTWSESVPLSLGPASEEKYFSAIRPINISSHPPLDLHRDWLMSIEVYSSRSMTKASDRLPAISGYAHEIHKVLGGNYLAGIWESYFASGLLWVVQKDGQELPKVSQKRAPSWSWASRDDQISYFWPLQRIISTSMVTPHLELMGHDINVAGLNAMGEVTGGVLTVSGPLRRISWHPPPLRRSGVLTTASDTWYRLPEFDGGKCLFDCHDDEIPESLWCLVVAVEVKSVNCLVLSPTGSEGDYRRVGFARIRRVWDIEAFLSKFQVTTVTIV